MKYITLVNKEARAFKILMESYQKVATPHITYGMLEAEPVTLTWYKEEIRIQVKGDEEGDLEHG